MLKLVDEQGKSSWFFLNEPVQRFISGKLEPGDKLSIEVTDGEEEGSKLITKVTSDKLTGTASASASTGGGYSKPAYSTGNKWSGAKKSYSTPTTKTYGGYSKSPQEQEQISRLAIFHDAARIASSLGLTDPRVAVTETIAIYNELYNAFKASVTTQPAPTGDDVAV
jgi:hypothetical protein